MPAPSPIRPRALRPGDTIGIVSPSWFGGPAFVPRARRGIATLESLGYRVRVADHAFNNLGHVSDTAAKRTRDLHAMFADPEVAAILCTIGGDHSCHLLPLIDWDLIARNPKIFMGFSDITVLNNAIWSQTGLTTFNGPSLLTDWAEYPAMPEISLRSALGVLTEPRPFGDLPASDTWTDEFLDWETGEDLTRPRRQHPSGGWRWIRPGTAEGHLVGGCLESLQHLRGTRFWPNCEGAILCIETSETRPSPATLDGMLMDLENMGVFDQIAGLLVGRPYGMSPDQRDAFWAVVTERTTGFGFPVVGDLDIGHTTPLLTLPIGCRARVDSQRRRVSIVESAVTPGPEFGPGNP
ncbi:MAG TPA: S66 peptidase family protein [Thermomicrobiales bacterium]|nr:S66 peptidase family protein [Thermomicrobiales bacterium]